MTDKDYSFSVKKGDTHKVLRFHFRRENSDGSYTDVNLTGATVKFYMKERGQRALTINGTSCTISAATSGKGYYSWQSADVDTPGIYDGEFIVTFSDSSTETFPDDRDITITILDDVE